MNVLSAILQLIFLQSGYSSIDKDETSTGVIILFIILAVIAIIFIILYVIGGWKMFKKAGKPGYAILVPYVDLWIILEIIGRPYWWIFLYMIIAPIIWIIISIDIAKSFGKSIGFGIGIIFLPFIFIPIIGLGKAEYKGSLAQKK